MNEDTKQFIKEHLHEDTHQLLLQAKRYPEVDMDLAVRQITGSRKMQNKVPAFYECEQILYPVRLSLEQASSEITAEYKSTLCTGRTFADLTGGFGIDCFFISKNFEQAVYVEKQKELCELAKHNFEMLHAENIAVINADAEDYLNGMQTVDCIYLDPARRSSAGKKLVLLVDCEPDVQKLAPKLLQKAETVLIKLSPMLDISASVRDLPNVCGIHILAVENDCKEVLLVLQRQEAKDICVAAINFLKNKTKQVFEYKFHQEADAVAKCTSEVKQYLYEPNAAVMKSGAFRFVSEYFNMEKLHANTHLYTSDEYISDFPGRIFEVSTNWGNSKKDWKKRPEKIEKANITVRNYPIGVNELREKLKLPDGGDCYLFACTLANNEKTIIECYKKQKIESDF